jgi:hypothetical protein
MAKYGSPSFAVFLVDGYSLLSAKLQEVAETVEIELEPSDGLGDVWREKTPTGMRTATLEQSGAFFDTTANGIHAALSGMPATERIVAWALADNVLGNIFTAVKGAFVSKYRAISTVGKLTKADVMYAVTGALDEGVILAAHGPQTVDWTGTAVDNGASSANGGVGYLLVSAFSGLTGAIVTIQHSPDNSTWADLVTFTNVTAAPAKQRIEVGGTVNRYLRANGDVTGTGSLTPFVGFARNS